MRTVCPASSRFFGWVRLPFTRTSPLRITRWIWEKLRPGNRASKKRSTRIPFSSAVTATFCTLVGIAVGGTSFCFASSRGGRPPGAAFGRPDDKLRRASKDVARATWPPPRPKLDLPGFGFSNDKSASADLIGGFGFPFAPRTAGGPFAASGWRRAKRRCWRDPAICLPPPGCRGPREPLTRRSALCAAFPNIPGAS